MYDFLIEEAISEASCYDIGMEQYFAEMEVLSALSEAYAKQLQMATYYQEGEVGDTLKVAGVAAGVGAIGLGAAAVWLITLPIRIIIALIKGIINIIKKIIGFFTGANKATTKNIKKLIDRLEKLPADKKDKFIIKTAKHNWYLGYIVNVPENESSCNPNDVERLMKAFVRLSQSKDPIADFDDWLKISEFLRKYLGTTTNVYSDTYWNNKVNDQLNNDDIIVLNYETTVRILKMVLELSEKLPEFKANMKDLEIILKEKQEEAKKLEEEAKTSKNEYDKTKAQANQIKYKMIQNIGNSLITFFGKYIDGMFKWYNMAYKQIIKYDFGDGVVWTKDIDV